MSSGPKRIVLDVTPLRSWSGFRGIGRFIYDLLNGLAVLEPVWSRHFEFEVIHDLQVGGQFETSRDLRACAAEAFAARGTRGADLLSARRRHLVRITRSLGADVLHVTEAIGLPRLIPLPWVVTCYDLIPLRLPDHYLPGRVAFLRQYGRALAQYHAARRSIAISQKTADELQALLRLPASRIDVVPLGIDAEVPSESEDEVTRRLQSVGVGTRSFLLYAGYSDYRKNVEGMMAALSHARRSADIELVWAGQLPPGEIRKIRRLAREVGVGPHVRLLGFVPGETMQALFRRALAHIFISRLEGFGLSVAEAMVAGCPVIAARSSGSDEVAGPAGIIVDPDDPIDAGNAVLRLASDRSFRDDLIAKGRERATYFSKERMARDYLRAYARALQVGVEFPQEPS